MAKTRKMHSKEQAVNTLKGQLEGLSKQSKPRFFVGVMWVDENDLLKTQWTTWDFPTALFSAAVESLQEFTKINTGGNNTEKALPLTLRPADMKRIESKLQGIVDKALKNTEKDAS